MIVVIRVNVLITFDRGRVAATVVLSELAARFRDDRGVSELVDGLLELGLRDLLGTASGKQGTIDEAIA